jgi:hypothetical protein
MQVFLAASIIGCIIGAPSLLVWGWVRWAQRPQPRSFFPILSLAGFLFATASGLLAVSSFTYSLAVGGLPYYDPRLLSIFSMGLLAVVGRARTGHRWCLATELSSLALPRQRYRNPDVLGNGGFYGVSNLANRAGTLA